MGASRHVCLFFLSFLSSSSQRPHTSLSLSFHSQPQPQRTHVREYRKNSLSLHLSLSLLSPSSRPDLFSGYRFVSFRFSQQKQTALGLIERETPAKRPFVLSRSFFAGSQRWGAIWTGDNLGTWAHLEGSFPMLLSLGIAGQTFSGGELVFFSSSNSSSLFIPASSLFRADSTFDFFSSRCGRFLRCTHKPTRLRLFSFSLPLLP